ncbi:MAG: hypothetical protein K2M12_00585, partial [Muribaculaceae bacterium]|nr:hypothetical protein [Muribaculaceae bacterium]
SSIHKPKPRPEKVSTIETIKGRIPLTNLNKEDDTPIAISVTPLLKTYEHPETLNVPKSTKNGVQSVQAEDNNVSTQYYDLNGTQVSHPTPGTAYIQRRGNVTRKVVLR